MFFFLLNFRIFIYIMNKLTKILLERDSQLLPDSTHFEVARRLVKQIPANILKDKDELEHFEYVFRSILDELSDKISSNN